MEVREKKRIAPLLSKTVRERRRKSRTHLRYTVEVAIVTNAPIIRSRNRQRKKRILLQTHLSVGVAIVRKKKQNKRTYIIGVSFVGKKRTYLHSRGKEGK